MSCDVRDSDDDPPRRSRDEPDPYGQAALLLAESILHALIETKAFTPMQALSAVLTASEVKVDVAAENGESAADMEQSLQLLHAIAHSLETDIAGMP